MFVRKLTLNKEGRQYSYLKVVENTWQKGRAVQRTLVNLGNVSNWPEEKLERLVTVLSGFLEMEMVSLSSVRLACCRVLGPYLPLARLWERLGLDEILAGALASRKMDQRAISCAKAMVLSRLVEPASKKAVWESVSRDCEIPGVDGASLPLCSYYRTLEYLAQSKVTIEKAIHRRLKHLFNQDVSLVFYDLTSAYFEGKRCPMARHGYSREHRPDLVQIEIGILVDAEGIPIGHQVFEGNVKDGIGLRPIRHWNDFRVLGHVFVCVLAYTIERLYERELAKAGLAITARTALDELRSVVVATLSAGEKSLTRRSEITPSQHRLLAAVGITEVPELW
jgi:hypothetical protein